MLYSFDPAVNAQARGLLETNAMYFCTPAINATCEFGQMLHHFVPSCDKGDTSCTCMPSPVKPSMTDCFTYQAISGATQTGPNIFWTLAALQYAATTGDTAWLQAYIGPIRTSMKFLMDRYA